MQAFYTAFYADTNCIRNKTTTTLPSWRVQEGQSRLSTSLLKGVMRDWSAASPVCTSKGKQAPPKGAQQEQSGLSTSLFRGVMRDWSAASPVCSSKVCNSKGTPPPPTPALTLCSGGWWGTGPLHLPCVAVKYVTVKDPPTPLPSPSSTSLFRGVMRDWSTASPVCSSKVCNSKGKQAPPKGAQQEQSGLSTSLFRGVMRDWSAASPVCSSKVCISKGKQAPPKGAQEGQSGLSTSLFRGVMRDWSAASPAISSSTTLISVSASLASTSSLLDYTKQSSQGHRWEHQKKKKKKKKKSLRKQRQTRQVSARGNRACDHQYQIVY